MILNSCDVARAKRGVRTNLTLVLESPLSHLYRNILLCLTSVHIALCKLSRNFYLCHLCLERRGSPKHDILDGRDTFGCRNKFLPYYAYVNIHQKQLNNYLLKDLIFKNCNYLVLNL